MPGIEKEQNITQSSVVKPMTSELTVGDDDIQAQAPVGNRPSSVVKPAKRGLTLGNERQALAPAPTSGLGDQRKLMDPGTIVSGPELDPELVTNNELLPIVRKSDRSKSKPDLLVVDLKKNLYE